jgi:hypothetical protein
MTENSPVSTQVAAPKSTSSPINNDLDTETTTHALPSVSTSIIYLNPAMGQSNHSIIYFKELTIKDNPLAGVDVWINSPLEINHNVSIPGRWGGNIKTTIDTNWNITVTFSVGRGAENKSDQWFQHNQWTYGWMKIETFLQSGVKITEYNTNYCGGITQGAYYAMRKAWTEAEDRSISQSNSNRKLTFRSKDILVKISANIVGYYVGTKRDSMEINISDTVAFGTINNTSE